jgi:hypothetical protein
VQRQNRIKILIGAKKCIEDQNVWDPLETAKKKRNFRTGQKNSQVQMPQNTEIHGLHLLEMAKKCKVLNGPKILTVPRNTEICGLYPLKMAEQLETLKPEKNPHRSKKCPKTPISMGVITFENSQKKIRTSKWFRNPHQPRKMLRNTKSVGYTILKQPKMLN